MGFPGGVFGNQSGLTNLTISQPLRPGPHKSLIGSSPPDADASFHTGAHGSTGGANVDEAPPTGAGEAALNSAGSSAVGLVPSAPHAEHSPPTALPLQKELEMLQQRDKENKLKKQRDEDKGGHECHETEEPQPKAGTKEEAQSRPQS